MARFSASFVHLVTLSIVTLTQSVNAIKPVPSAANANATNGTLFAVYPGLDFPTNNIRFISGPTLTELACLQSCVSTPTCQLYAYAAFYGANNTQDAGCFLKDRYNIGGFLLDVQEGLAFPSSLGIRGQLCGSIQTPAPWCFNIVR